MRVDLQSNKFLILVLSIPVVAVLIFVAVFYAPRLFAPDPQYDFLYYAPVLSNQDYSIDVYDIETSVQSIGKTLSLNPSEEFVRSIYNIKRKETGLPTVSSYNLSGFDFQSTEWKEASQEASTIVKDFVKFYVYDVQLKVSREISYLDAKNLNLFNQGSTNSVKVLEVDSNRRSKTRSPDGFRIECGKEDYDIFDSYQSSDCSKVYITGNGARIRLKNLMIGDDDRYYYSNRWSPSTYFLGWIVPDN